MRFKNKTILITGANGEMARCMTKLSLKEGAYVFMLVRDKHSIKDFTEELKKQNLNNFEVLVAQIQDQKEIEILVKKLIKKYSKIDILINHVGVTNAQSLQKTNIKSWEEDIDINLNGTFYVSKACLKYMKKAKSGNIVTIGSVNSDHTVGNPAYSACKAALVSFTKAIATEYGQYNIRANTVSPGSVRTKAWNHRIEKNPKTFENLLKWYPLKRLAKPIDIAKATLFLASDDAACISGVNLRVDAGLSAGIAPFAKDITSESFGV